MYVEKIIYFLKRIMLSNSSHVIYRMEGLTTVSYPSITNVAV